MSSKKIRFLDNLFVFSVLIAGVFTAALGSNRETLPLCVIILFLLFFTYMFIMPKNGLALSRQINPGSILVWKNISVLTSPKKESIYLWVWDKRLRNAEIIPYSAKMFFSKKYSNGYEKRILVTAQLDTHLREETLKYFSNLQQWVPLVKEKINGVLNKKCLVGDYFDDIKDPVTTNFEFLSHIIKEAIKLPDGCDIEMQADVVCIKE